MGPSAKHGKRLPARTSRRRGQAYATKTRYRPTQPRVARADRKSLLRGTALVSTLLLGGLFAPELAQAQAVNCVQPPQPAPIVDLSATNPIVCVNTEPRTSNALDPGLGASLAIGIVTDNADNFIRINNSADLTADLDLPVVGPSLGIFAAAGIGAPGAGSFIEIVNSGDIDVATDVAVGPGLPPAGILGLAFGGPGSFIDIDNDGDISVSVGITIGTNIVGIAATTFADDNRVKIENRGDVTVAVDNGADFLAVGLGASSNIFARSPIEILNDGGALNVTVGDGNDVRAFGMASLSGGQGSPIQLVNEGGDIIVTAGDGDLALAAGIYANSAYNPGGFLSYAPDSPIRIVNTGDIAATIGDGVGALAVGIFAQTFGTGSSIDVENSGDIAAISGSGDGATGIGILGFSINGGPINIVNSGDIVASGTSGVSLSPLTPAPSAGIAAFLLNTVPGAGSSLNVENHGAIALTVDSVGYGGIPAAGILGVAGGIGNSMAIENSGAIDITIGDGFAQGIPTSGIFALGQSPGSLTEIRNSGDITVTGGYGSAGVGMLALGVGPIDIENDGDIVATVLQGNGAIAGGIGGQTDYEGASVSIVNRGNVTMTTGNGDFTLTAGIHSTTTGDDSPINIENSGGIAVATGNGAGSLAFGIYAVDNGANSPISILNSGDIAATAGNGPGSYGVGILARPAGANSPVLIDNSGSVFGSGAGIYAYSNTGTTIVNSGDISAGPESPMAIFTRGASTEILNTGRITGFVTLTDEPDRFFNQAGGVFETKLTSDFGGGNDLFRNETGGTVQAATDPGARERSTIVNLERFENRGLISMVDGRVGDTFTIMNTSAAARDLTFVASGNSALAVDAFLGGPGSVADEFIVYGDISGRTALHVNNTNSNTGSAGAVIPVIVAESDNVKPDAFYLAQPIDTGFFNYDLFFRPTGSGVFELRSFVGGGSLLLPQLVTGAQDIWHATSSTWFDRTADLRVLLAGGGSPIAYDPTAGYADGVAAGPAAFTPAVWARGGGNWLDRQGSETVNAFGNNYRFKLDRDLEIMDFQMGLDLGKRDFLSQGDILVFGMLGGFVNADLDYDQLVRRFDFEGGQVGGYATYLRGGLFVDTLLNVHLLDLETATLGFPSSLDATTVGLRTDTGYRFGSFNGGAFIEPLATLAVLWSDIDGFTAGANRISFEDEANVRGRLGLRVGTSYAAWTGTTIEPFVIGSLWGNLSGDNQATLVSNGTNFRFEDDLDDVWGEVSAGVNFFNPSAATAVFAKVDVTFGDDVDGIGGKAGMRVSW